MSSNYTEEENKEILGLLQNLYFFGISGNLTNDDLSRINASLFEEDMKKRNFEIVSSMFGNDSKNIPHEFGLDLKYVTPQVLPYIVDGAANDSLITYVSLA